MPDVATVLDASALLALLQREPGSERVADAITRGGTIMSAVNYAEVIGKHLGRGKMLSVFQRQFRLLDIPIVPFGVELAEVVGALKPKMAPWGLSLADCACLAFAKQYGAVALTADTIWRQAGEGIRVVCIR